MSETGLGPALLELGVQPRITGTMTHASTVLKTAMLTYPWRTQLSEVGTAPSPIFQMKGGTERLSHFSRVTQRRNQ